MPINNLLDQVKKTEYFIKDIHPTEFFDKKNYDIVKVIKNNFPELKIIAKGDRILVNGDEVLINTLINRLDTLVVLINGVIILELTSGENSRSSLWIVWFPDEIVSSVDMVLFPKYEQKISTGNLLFK